MESNTDNIGCCGCGCPMPDNKLINGRPQWFGSYHNDKMIKFVCVVCYDRGIRTDLLPKK